MTRIGIVFLTAILAIAGCATPPPPKLGPDGRPLPQVYRISESEEDEVQLRFLEGINALRSEVGAPPLRLNSELTAAAATHSRDMSVQNRPWHFGSDGSSPIERVRRAGYSGGMLGENISETYETELETLAAWAQDPATRAVLLNSRARDLGFAWFQEPNGKLWWTMVTGVPQSRQAGTAGS